MTLLSALVGSLFICRCIIDKKARKFDAESCRLLSNFAEVVVREIEKDEERVCTFTPVAAWNRLLSDTLSCALADEMLMAL